MAKTKKTRRRRQMSPAELRPMLHAGVRVSRYVLAGGHLHCVVKSPLTSQEMPLPVAVAGLLMLFDGNRRVVDVFSVTKDYGVGLPSLAYLEAWCDTFEKAGLIRQYGHRVRALPNVGFACDGCGFSCRGPDIALESAAAAQQLQSQWQTLSLEHPQLAERQPIIENDGRFFLERMGGECPFLNADNRCLIHLRFGYQAKPLACRIFPLVAVAVGGELRLGMSGACLRHHRHFDRGGYDLNQAWHDVADRVQPFNLTPPPSDQNSAKRAEVEARLFDYLERSADLTASQLIAIAGLARPPRDLNHRIPDSLLDRTRERIVAWAKSFDNGAPWPHRFAPLGAYAELFTAGRRAILVHSNNIDLATVPPSFSRYVMFRMRNQVFLRQRSHLASLRAGLVLQMHGFIASLLVATMSDEHDFDRFSQFVSVFDQVCQHPNDVQQLFGIGQLDDVAESWKLLLEAEGWR